MMRSTTLLGFSTLLLGAAIASAQPVTSTAKPASGRSDCSGELARQSIARMQRQAQPEGRVGSDCLARQRAVPVESAAASQPAPEPLKVADAGSQPQP